jgi:hypothetical protein
MWWALELQAMACGPRNPEDASGQHFLEHASFDEVHPLAEERAVWWSTEDICPLVDLADIEENNSYDGNVKEELEDPLEDSYSDDGAYADYSMLYRCRYFFKV